MISISWAKTALLSATTLWLAGCASTGNAPPAHLPLNPAALGAQADASTAWPPLDWWTRLNDPQLDELVQRALAGQPSLGQAEARLRLAAAATGLHEAATQPQVMASADLTYQRFTENGMVPQPLAGSTMWNNGLQVAGSWELDLFGRQRSALDAAIGQQRAAEADLAAARLLLTSQVVAGYVQLARLVDAQALAQQGLALRELSQALMNQRHDAGLDTANEPRIAQGSSAQARLELAALDDAIVHARLALAELSGQGPQALARLSPHLSALPPAPVPTGLPADLLGRRPDLVAQRWRVQASQNEVEAARAQFYPNVNLVAFAGLSSLGLDKLLELGSRSMGIGPAVRLPLFDGTRLRAQLGGRRAEADAAVDAYNASLLRALREVADETQTLGALARQQADQDEASAAAEAQLGLARQRHAAGLSNRLGVLAAESQTLAQRRAALELQARRLGSEIALARALGGGYGSPTNTNP